MMAAVLFATGLYLYLRLEASLNSSIDQHLRSRAHGLIAEIRVSDVGLGEAARSALDARPDAFAQVLTSSGRLFDSRAQPSRRPVLSTKELRTARSAGLTVEPSSFPGSPEGERLLARPFVFERHHLVGVVGESVRSRDEALSRLLALALIGGPVALLLSSLAAYWTVGAALRPVEAMRSRAADVSAAGSAQRLPMPPARDELHRLGETLNEMLDRLRAAIDRERAFVDDASHELRTPLAVHKTELELALRYGATNEELRAALASGVEQVDRLSNLAENLLVLARSDEQELGLAPTTIGVADLFAAARGRTNARAAEVGRKVVVDDAGGVAVRADPTRVEQALGNLLENALRYGDGPVRMWADSTDGRVELHVSDRGPGFPPEFLPHAFERFRQADAARSSEGAGLGLAIVDAIARAHGGRAMARNADGGGADVWIELEAVDNWGLRSPAGARPV